MVGWPVTEEAASAGATVAGKVVGAVTWAVQVALEGPQTAQTVAVV